MIYVVKSGDTLQKISDETRIPVQKIIADNQLIYSERLVPGQALLLLGEGEEGDLAQGYLKAGYAYPFIDPPVLEAALPSLGRLLVFSYGFTFEGDLVPPRQDDCWMAERAAEMNVEPWMVLTPFSSEGAFNNQLIRALVENEELQDRLTAQMLEMMERKGYRGVDIDFEYILPENKEQYVQFVGKVKQRMGKSGYRVTVAAAPKTSDRQRYTYGPPMAVAPLDKVREVVEYALTRIPPEKIILGIPNYGYDWPLPYERGITRARSIGNEEAVEIAVENGASVEYAEVSRSPWFTYRKNGMEHVVWFEDVRSIRAKWELVREYGLSGAGYWNLMRPFSANWLMLGTDRR